MYIPRSKREWAKHGIKVYAKHGKFNIGDVQAQYRLEAGSGSDQKEGCSIYTN